MTSNNAASTSPEAASSTTTSLPSTAHITKSSAYYDIDMTYPSATPLVGISADANTKAVAHMKGSMQSAIDQFISDGSFASITPKDAQEMGITSERKEALSSEYTTFTSKRTVSYQFAIYEDTLGAHPNTYFKTFTYDTETGKELALGDIFTTGTDYPTLLKTRARADLPKIIQSMNGEADTDMIKEGINFSTSTLPTFYIDNTNLVLLFAPYEVGPYALGTITDEIPLSSLSLHLNFQY